MARETVTDRRIRAENNIIKTHGKMPDYNSPFHDAVFYIYSSMKECRAHHPGCFVWKTEKKLLDDLSPKDPVSIRNLQRALFYEGRQDILAGLTDKGVALVGLAAALPFDPLVQA